MMTVSEIKTMRKDNVVINRRYDLLSEPNISQLSNNGLVSLGLFDISSLCHINIESKALFLVSYSSIDPWAP